VAEFKKPRKINWVSAIFIVIGLGLIYTLIQFGPPYYRKWKVKSVLSESANKLFPRRRQIKMGVAEGLLEKVKSETRKAMEELGIEDPSIQVFATIEDKEVSVSVDYTEQVNHPLVNKVTKLRFRPSSSVEVGARLVE
jgi:hypothetical protein